MPDATNPRRQWFQYTDGLGRTWAVKVDKNWGNNADSGLVAYGGGGPALGSDLPFPVNSRRSRLRQGVYKLEAGGTSTNTTVGFATTKRVLGTSTAAAGVSGYVLTAGAEGIAGSVLYRLSHVIPPRDAIASSQPDPIPEPTGV